MARVIGSVSRNTNYEITIKKPIDARSLVKTYEDLTDNSNWVNDAGNPICYNGMLVAVANTSDITYNGVYFLFDPNCTDTKKSPDVTNTSHWIKIGETSDISALLERVTTIESELESVKDRLDILENESDVETYGYRSGFPTAGETNKLYVAVDEGKTYIWFNGEYMRVGGDSEQPDVIFGGTAD